MKSAVVTTVDTKILILQGLKARNFIHAKIEENIKRKLRESNSESKCRDALQQLIDSSRKSGQVLSMQVKKYHLIIENEHNLCLRA